VIASPDGAAMVRVRNRCSLFREVTGVELTTGGVHDVVEVLLGVEVEDPIREGEIRAAVLAAGGPLDPRDEILRAMRTDLATLSADLAATRREVAELRAAVILALPGKIKL
jgi:hypothetical protein